ncbi:phage tail assembly chaperone [Brevundimonas sp.]|jgi:uncharacterized phage protein (TIGR02216 family)|uniref:phage tail assembly chaperone n=1 Tax=Brevundimonas sp. TaxID=1871086 RepID=UPI003784E8A1
MTADAQTPWAAMLGEAVRLGVMPEAFWRLSVREWRMLTERPGAGAGALGRDGLERLAQAWPDE